MDKYRVGVAGQERDLWYKIYVEEGLPRTPVQLSYWDVIRSSGLHPLN
jgi:hypothetical protein